MPLAEQSLSEGFHQMFSDVVTHGHQLMNVDPRQDDSASACDTPQ